MKETEDPAAAGEETDSAGKPGQRIVGNAGPAPRPGTLKPVTFPIPRIVVVLLGLGCLMFVLLGLFIIAAAGWPAKIVGVVAILFFGVGGAIGIWKAWRVPVVLTLVEEGIRVQSGGFIPWDDVAAVGIGRAPGGRNGTKIIGIRLSSYERYVASFTPEELRIMRRTAKAGRIAGNAMGNAPGWSSRPETAVLGSIPQQEAADIVRWVRHTSGWDVTFSPLMFGRPSKQVVREIVAYNNEVVKLRSRT